MQLLRFILRNYKRTILPLAAFAAIMTFALYCVYGADGTSSRQQYDLTMRAIRRAADDCFAIEGQYPPNIKYLCENYHVRVDTNKFIVIYEIFSPDIRPAIMLINRG